MRAVLAYAAEKVPFASWWYRGGSARWLSIVLGTLIKLGRDLLFTRDAWVLAFHVSAALGRPLWKVSSLGEE